MRKNTIKKSIRFLGLSFFLMCNISCNKNLTKEIVVYKNDFEKSVITGIADGKVEDYNGSKVLGRYAQSGFQFDIGNLQTHDMIQVSFDLYIHDNWNGNAISSDISGSDVWLMNVEGQSIIYTTFSNTSRIAPDLRSQSFPNNYPFVNNLPGSNAFKIGLPGACKINSTAGTTTKYRIVKTFPHTGSHYQFACYNQLPAAVAADICNKSWSIDNLKITAIIFPAL